MLSILLSVIGISAMQVCGIGAPVCGATVGFGLLSFLFPQATHFFSGFSIHIIVATMFLQVIALFYMGCFRKCLQ
jgi:hypothetical protein